MYHGSFTLELGCNPDSILIVLNFELYNSNILVQLNFNEIVRLNTSDKVKKTYLCTE